MYLDIKNTVWERIEFDNEEQMNDVVSKLKSGELSTGSDVSEYLGKGTEILEDTMTEMEVCDNEGFSTLEVTDVSDIVYSNGNI